MGERIAKLQLAGELTIYRAAAIKSDLLGAIDACDELEIDLSGVTEIDTSAIQLLLAAKREMTAKEGQLRLSGHSAPVVDAFDLFGLASYFGDPVLLHNGNSVGVEP